MKNSLLVLVLCLSSVLLCQKAFAVTPRIIGPDMKIIDSNIIVSLSIDNITELEATINSGIGKEIAFTVELLRVWKFWPDEFVVSKKIEKVVKYDNLRELYQVSSYDGIKRTVKSFENYNAVKSWLFSASGINLANIKELEPSKYYVRVVVESKSMEQLPLLGLLMHFIPEVEMSLAKESQPFIIEDNK
jgi:hypothetical protein